MLIGRLQSCDIGCAVCTVSVERAAAGPVKEDVPVDPGQVGVCHDPRPTPVAVGEGMDPDQAVMQARCRFQRVKAFVVAPVPGVIEAGAQLGRDVPDRHLDDFLGQAVDARPIPDLTQEAPVDFAGSSVGQKIEGFGAAVAPGQARDDVLTFPLVHLAVGRDVFGPEAKQRVWCQGRRTSGFIKLQRHCQKSRRPSQMMSAARSSIIAASLRSPSLCSSSAICARVRWMMRRAFARA